MTASLDIVNLSRAVAALARRITQLEMAVRTAGMPVPPPAPNLRLIFSVTVQEVCRFFQIKRAYLLGRSRKPSAAHPRAIAMYITRTVSGASLPEVGSLFDRKHCSVCRAIHTLENLLRVDPAAHRAIADLLPQVREEVERRTR